MGMSRTPPGPRGRLAARALAWGSLLLGGGCGGGATTVEVAEPLSAAETERLIGGVRGQWAAGGEATADPVAGQEHATGPRGR